jgi:glycosyltransferase involved in cell wall biosynthesis
MTRPRLLVLASTYPRWAGDHEPGFVHELARRLLDHFEVLVLTSRAPGASEHEWLDGVEVFRYRYAPRRWETLVYGGGIAMHLKNSPWKWLLVPGFVMAQVMAAARIARLRRVILVHAHWLLPQGAVAWLLWRVQCVPRYVVTSHGGDLYGFHGRLAQSLKRRVAQDAAAMTVVSTVMLDEAKQIDLRPPRLEVIPMGADLQVRFVPDADVPRSHHELLFVGRLVEKKGLSHLLDAMPRVLRSHPHARLTIAGFGPLRGELENQARRLGIDGQVSFPGAVTQKELPSLYQRAAMVVAPFVRAASGDQEGLPVVLMEAIGCGCPIVASDIPGVRDLAGENSEGMLVPPGDVPALVAAVTRLLDDPKIALELALARRAACLHRIDWSSVAGAYSRVLADAMAATENGAE